MNYYNLIVAARSVITKITLKYHNIIINNNSDNKYLETIAIAIRPTTLIIISINQANNHHHQSSHYHRF